MRTNWLGRSRATMVLAAIVASGLQGRSGVADDTTPPAKQDANPVTQASAEKKETLPAPPVETQKRLLELHNLQRRRSGLGPMRLDDKLTAAAQRFATFLSRNRNYGHYADGRSPGDRIAAEGYEMTSWAENLAWSVEQPDDAVNVWMNSSGHRANILSGHEQIGFGKVGSIWVAVFANPAQRQGTDRQKQ